MGFGRLRRWSVKKRRRRHGRAWPMFLAALTLLAALCLASSRPACAAPSVASSHATLIAAGTAHSCMIQSGAAYCWGNNSNGQLGDGSTTNSTSPVPVYTGGVLAGRTLTQIVAGGSSTCALDSTGLAYCWGLNTSGQLGNNSTTQSPVPVAVSTSGVLAGKTLTQLAAGNAHVCALDSTGTAYCWGSNGNGQLGINSTTKSLVPVAVSTSGVLSGVTLTQITAGFGHTCAVSSAGAAYCWGANGNGQLGNSSTTQSLVPVAVSTSGVLSGVSLTQISADQGGRTPARCPAREPRTAGAPLLRPAGQRRTLDPGHAGGGDHLRGAVRGDPDPDRDRLRHHLRAVGRRAPATAGVRTPTAS